MSKSSTWKTAGPMRMIVRHGVHYGQEGREGQVGGSAPGYKHAAGGENWTSTGRGSFSIMGEVDEEGKQRSSLMYENEEGFFVLEFTQDSGMGQQAMAEITFMDADSAVAAGNRWLTEGQAMIAARDEGESIPGEAEGVEPWLAKVDQPGPTTVYRGVAAKNIDKILQEGMVPADPWLGRPPSVYFTQDYGEAVTYMNMYRPSGHTPGDVYGAVVEFTVPDEADKDVIFDEFHQGDAWRMERDVPAEWIKKIYTYDELAYSIEEAQEKKPAEVITRAESEGKTYYAWVNFEPEEEGEVGQDDSEEALDQDQEQLEPQAKEELGDAESPGQESEGRPQPQPGMGSKTPPLEVAAPLSEDLEGYYSAEEIDGDLMEAPEFISAGVSAGNTTEIWHELALEVLRQQPEDVQAKIAQVEADIREGKVPEVEAEVPVEIEEVEVVEPGETAPEEAAPEEAAEPAADRKFDQPPIVTLVGGLSSAGKSTWIRQNAGSGIVIIEPEELKAENEGYEGWNSALFADQAAKKVQELVQNAVQKNYTLIIENNFSDPDTTVSITRAFQEKGYEVNFVYIDVSMEDAMLRAMERFNGPTNRYTSLMYLAFQDGKNIETFKAMEGVADNVTHIDNTQEKGQAMTPIKSEPEPETVEVNGQKGQINETELEAVGPMRMVIKHHGPGDHPSGSPQSVHAGEGASRAGKQAGLTSARPGKESRKVFVEMEDFENRLAEIQSIRNSSVRPGLGGWEGGREPTWIVEYEGDGEAAKLIAETARQHDQDAALIFEEAGEGEGSPVTDFIVGEHVSPADRDQIESALVESGLGGWTWMRTTDGKRLVRAVAIPQWGGSEETHKQSVTRVQDFFSGIGIPIEISEGRVRVSVLDRENDYALAGGD